MKLAMIALAVAGTVIATGVWGGDDAVLAGHPSAEHLGGSSADDVIVAEAGDDRIVAGEGDDVVLAGAGDDAVRGGAGADELRGGPGDDRLDGGDDDARDRVVGGPGDDRLFVRGPDVAVAGSGDDRIIAVRSAVGTSYRCGPGVDVLVLVKPAGEVHPHGCEHVRFVGSG
ncbi:calcium-binding protein [Nocardioides sp.]|uniref:calcium-binding protein n=1 Tax=Nocardioides sp. TaxID=35761 RepID=UPI00352786E6